MKTSSTLARFQFIKRGSFTLRPALLVVGVALSVPSITLAETEVFKANNTDALNLTSSWSDGVVPGANDVAVWNNTVSVANTSTMGANLSFEGIKVTGTLTGAIGISATTFASGAVTADPTSDTITFSSGAVNNGDAVIFSGTTPAGLVTGRPYYVVNVSGSTYQISDSLNGPPVDFTTTGSSLNQNVQSVLTLGSSGIVVDGSRSLNSLSAVVALSDNQTWTVATGRLLDSNANPNNSGIPVINNGYILTVDAAGTVDLGAYVGAGGLIKNGAGVLSMQAGIGGSFFTGDVTLNAGTLQLGNDPNSLGSGSSTFYWNGGILTAKGSADKNFGRNTFIGGNVEFYNNNSANSGARAYTLGTLDIGANSLTVTANTGSAYTTSSLTFGATTLSGNATFDVGSSISNSVILGSVGESGGFFGFTKTGIGVLVLTNAGTFSGEAVISNGILRMAHANALSNSTVNVAVSDGLAFSNITTANLGMLKGAGGLGLTNAAGAVVALTAGGNNQSTTYSGVMSGGGSLTKTGTGTLTLTGTNTYEGATTVSNGTLVVNGAVAGALSVDSGATLGGSGTIGGPATVAGNLNPGNSPGLLTFNSDLTLASSAITTMEIQGTVRGDDYDAVNVAGELTYGGALFLDFSNPFAAGSYSFDLFSATGGYNANFDTISLAGAYNGDLSYDEATTSWNYVSAGGDKWTFYQGTGTLEFDAVPEPSTYALLALAGAGLACHGIRRRYRR